MSTAIPTWNIGPAQSPQAASDWPVGTCPSGYYLTYDAINTPICLPQPPVTVQDQGCPACPWGGTGGAGGGGTGGGGTGLVAIAAALVLGTVAVAGAGGYGGHRRHQGGGIAHRARHQRRAS